MYNGVVRRPVLGFLVFITGAIFCTTAHANGRFPEAQLIESVPGSEGRTVFLRTTFGVLVSRDAGASWRWICERSLGYEGQWDPPIAVTRDGRLWVGLEGGLVSTRDGCQVERASELDGQTLKDLTTDPRGETVWAITGAPTKRSFVWRRAPGGRFERLAGFDDTNLMTIEVAPSRPSRVYLSGQPYSTIRGRILRSDDGGATFVVASEGDAGVTGRGLSESGPLFIGSVDPLDPERLLLRHLHAKGSELYLSRDGGRTLLEVLSMKSAMFGFAKSADGKTIWAGSGLPEHGLLRSTDRGEHFEVVSRHGVLCLHAAGPEALFLCENTASLGAPAVAVARDGVGRVITPLARFSDVAGPIACEGGDARASLCGEGWAELRALLSGPTVADAGPVPAPDAGSSASRSRSGGGCGCVAGAGSHESYSAVWAALCALLALLVKGGFRITRGSESTHRVGFAAAARRPTHDSARAQRAARSATLDETPEESR
jgi:hypothetical protein